MEQATAVMEVEELAERLAAAGGGGSRRDCARDGKQRLLLLDVRESYELRMCDLRRHLERTGQLQFQDAPQQRQLVNAAEWKPPAEPRQDEEEERRRKWMPRARRGERLEIGYEVDEVSAPSSEMPALRGCDEQFYFVHIPMGQLGQRVHELRPFIADERSHLVTQQLRATGFDRARNLAGGLAAWTSRIDDSLPSYKY